MNFLNHCLEIVSKNITYYNGLVELNFLSDSELNDIGITRGEIPARVYLATYGR